MALNLKRKFKGETIKIAIIGANGKSGANLVNEALKQGYDVTAIVRNKEYKNKSVKVVYKDIFELTKFGLAGFDAVISAFAAWSEETFPLHKKAAAHLLNLLEGTDTRLIVVGGAGTLFVDSKGTMLMDTPDFPAAYMGVAKATAESYFVLKGSANVLWTYVSPAADYDENGARTGKYVLGGDDLILNSQNESYISYADLALAIIDELKNKKFIQKRFNAVGERA
ncbi:NAD(P)-dependent oxidoreductase [Campylobacter concisus]|uniref:NAD(P)-dependent oxidoreductase n=1 Tax=Campylobacter concisus TaxID=199 RepID=UPI00294AAB90|nr:NAD(P)H-binding protein [Campylobacter concisus]